MSTRILSSLLAGILILGIGGSLLLRDRWRASYRAFAILCFNVALWYLLGFLHALIPRGGLLWLTLVVAAVIPVNAERFFQAFPSTDLRARAKGPTALALGGSALLILFLLVAPLYAIHRNRWFVAVLYAFVAAVLYRCVFRFYQRARASASRPESVRLTYLLYGGVVSLTFAITDSLPVIGIPFPALGSTCVVLYMYLISQSLFHYRLLDIKELLAKMLSLAALLIILSSIYALLLSWVGTRQFSLFAFNTVVASFVVLVVLDPLRGWVENRVNRWLFAEKYEFARRMALLRQYIVNIIEERPLVLRLLSALETSGRVTDASIYLADPATSMYRLAGHIGRPPPHEIDGVTRRLFFEYLQQQGSLTVESVGRALEEQLLRKGEDEAVALRNVLDGLRELNSDLCLALTSDGQLLGVLSLRDDRLREAYAADEIDQLREVAAQAAITLRNSKIYEEKKERDRLAALGQMAAGLAHEIRNPLGAIKGAAQLLRVQGDHEAANGPISRGGENAWDSSPTNCVNIIVEEVDRLNHVVSQFLGYARPNRAEHEPVSVNDVLRRSVELIRSGHGGVTINTDLATSLPQVLAAPDELHQVFLNLLMNALQAMSDGGQIDITSRIRHAFRDGKPVRLIELAFRDSGPGIPADQLTNVFIPFFTTKEKGTGLGLPISQRIVENHGGVIEASSEPGQGSTFRVVLPTHAQR